MKTTRIREKIKKFLGDRPRNTAEILEYINSTMRHGTTSQQRQRTVQGQGHCQGRLHQAFGILSGGYDICEWATRTWVSENCPEWVEGTPIIVDSEGNFKPTAMRSSDSSSDNRTQQAHHRVTGLFPATACSRISRRDAKHRFRRNQTGYETALSRLGGCLFTSLQRAPRCSQHERSRVRRVLNQCLSCDVARKQQSGQRRRTPHIVG